MRKGHIRCLPFWCLIPSFWCANGCFFCLLDFLKNSTMNIQLKYLGAMLMNYWIWLMYTFKILHYFADKCVVGSFKLCQERAWVLSNEMYKSTWGHSLSFTKKQTLSTVNPFEWFHLYKTKGFVGTHAFRSVFEAFLMFFLFFFGWLYPEVLVACYSSTLVASRPGHCPSHPSYHNAWNRTLVEALLTTSSTWSSEGFIAPCILFEQPWFETYYSLDVWCMYDLNTTFLKDEYIWERESLRHRHIPLRFFFFWFCSEVLLCPTKAPAAVCLASCLGLLVSFSGFKVLNLGPVFGIWFEHIWIWSTSLSSLEHFNMVSLENETLWSSGKCNISLEFWVDMLAAPCF